MTRWMMGIAVLAGLVAASGCGNQTVLGEAVPGGDGFEWVLVEGVPMVEGYPITLRFEDSRAAGTAACNHYGGSVSVTDDRFRVGDVERTAMGCPDPGVHDSESAYLDALLAVDRFRYDEPQLVLLGPDVELRFDPVAPEEDAELTGTDWQLESLIEGTGPDGTVSSTMAEATLRLDGDGTFSATDGCNSFDGRWSTDNGSLDLSDVVSTDMACPDLDQQVTHIEQVLTGTPTIEHSGRRLRLAAGSRGLDYRAP